MSMAAKMLLSRKSLATYWARKWPLSCVAPDVSFHDSLLFSGVRAERALVKFHRYNQTVTFRGNMKPNSQKHILQNCPDVFKAKRSSFHSTDVNPPPLLYHQVEFANYLCLLQANQTESPAWMIPQAPRFHPFDFLCCC